MYFPASSIRQFCKAVVTCFSRTSRQASENQVLKIFIFPFSLKLSSIIFLRLVRLQITWVWEMVLETPLLPVGNLDKKSNF